MALPPLSPKLGKQVTSRQITWKEMAIRAWGSEYRAPDHGVYEFSNGRRFDSTDMLTTGIYQPPGIVGPGIGGSLFADSTLVTADTIDFTADGAVAGGL